MVLYYGSPSKPLKQHSKSPTLWTSPCLVQGSFLAPPSPAPLVRLTAVTTGQARTEGTSHILCSFLPSCLSLRCSSLWEHLSESTPLSLKSQILPKAFPSYPSLTNLPSPLFYLIGSGEILIMSYMIYYFFFFFSCSPRGADLLLLKSH